MHFQFGESEMKGRSRQDAGRKWSGMILNRIRALSGFAFRFQDDGREPRSPRRGGVRLSARHRRQATLFFHAADLLPLITVN